MNKALTLALRKLLLQYAKAAGNVLEEPTLILFKGEPTITKRTVIGDLTECDFDGYTAHADLAFGAPYLDGQDNVYMSAPSVQFTATGGTTPNSVAGFAIVNAGKTALYYAEAFENPVSINEAGDGLVVQPTLKYGL